jgi:hypothetical protein
VPQEAVEFTMLWIDHDSNVSSPNNQISGLRMLHPAKIIGAAVEIVRTYVGIRETRALIHRMNQV